MSIVDTVVNQLLQVVVMVVAVVIGVFPLVAAGRVFTGAVALADLTILVFVHLQGLVVVAKLSGRSVWDAVLVVDNAELVCEHLVAESGVSLVTNSHLAEVDHVINLDVVRHQVHAHKLGPVGAKTVTSELESITGVLSLEILYFIENLVTNNLEWHVAAPADLAVGTFGSKVLIVH